MHSLSELFCQQQDLQPQGKMLDSGSHCHSSSSKAVMFSPSKSEGVSSRRLSEKVTQKSSFVLEIIEVHFPRVISTVCHNIIQ